MDIQKNKKKLILAGGMAVLLIILLILSSSLKKARNTPRVNNPVELSQDNTIPDEKNLDDVWSKYDDNPIKKKRTDIRTGDSAMSENFDTDTESRIEEIFKLYPSPSFVSSGGDTLVYENGIYVRVDWIKPPKQGPDTVEIDGKRYVEIIENVQPQYTDIGNEYNN